MPKPVPSRRRKHARLSAAIKELGHALLAIYPDADGAFVVVNRPAPFDTVHIPLIVPEAGLPEPEGKVSGWGAEEPPL
jgi:hypothetical protein